MATTRGSVEERRRLRQQRRQANRVGHVRQRAQRASSNHQLVVVACNAALAASRRVDDDARQALAKAIAEAVERVDTAENQKERR